MSNVSNKETFSEDPEMNEFCKDLLDGVAEMKANSFARKTQVPVSNIVVIRTAFGEKDRGTIALSKNRAEKR